jgi:23S rRNA A2030 N6-methylase RlmJ
MYLLESINNRLIEANRPSSFFVSKLGKKVQVLRDLYGRWAGSTSLGKFKRAAKAVSPFNHAELVGNQGDLPKHAAIAAIVNSLAKPGEKFTWVESNAGRAVYKLPEISTLTKTGRAGWYEGVGKIPIEKKGPLASFSKSLGNVKPQLNDQYSGSHDIARRMAQNKGAKFEAILHDIDPEVVKFNKKFYKEHQTPLQMRERDGIRNVRNANKPSFVLIDPFDLSDPNIMTTINLLNKRKIPWMSWTAILGDPGKNIESQSSIEFHKQLAKKGRQFKIFHNKGVNEDDYGFNGSTITCSKEIASIIKPVISRVRRLMSWR